MAVDVKRIQEKLLEMAKAVASILERENIPHMLAYGTLLGAVRHKGFIPWDSDFDFYLFDDTYDRAKELLRAFLPSNFFLQDEKSEPLYFHGWAHVRDVFSEVFSEKYSQDSHYTYRGVAVDLYRTKLMPEYELSDYLLNEYQLYIDRRKKFGLISEEDYKNRQNQIALKRLKPNGEESKKNNYIYSMIIPYNCRKMEVKDVFPLKKYQFEDTYFYGPSNANNILTSIYGNYMKFPPVEQRVSTYSQVRFL